MKKNQVFSTRSMAFALSLVGLSFFLKPLFAYEKIISTTGNMSEVIAVLGLSDKLIAVDTTSTLPKAIMDEKPKIGYRRRLSAEGILSLQPDLLILAPDAGPPVVVEQIKAAKVPTLTIKDQQSVAGVIADIQLIANALGVSDKAQQLIDGIYADEKTIKTLVDGYESVPKIAFFMDGGTGQTQLMGLGNNSAGHAMINLVGGENVFAQQFDSIKPVSVESLINSDADMILIAAHGSDVVVTDKLENAVVDYPRLALTKAAKKQCLFRIGTVEALGFGPGFAGVAKDIAKQAGQCLD